MSAIEDGLRGYMIVNQYCKFCLNSINTPFDIFFFFTCTDLNGAIPAGNSPLAGKLFVVLGAGGAGKSLMVLHKREPEL